MGPFEYATDLAAAERLWRAAVPAETVFDLWEVRAAFHRHFDRPLRFLHRPLPDGKTALLPLSWVEEKEAWAFFPGETWHGKTWLEQNRAPEGVADLARLMEESGDAFHLRYLSPAPGLGGEPAVDETGYLFRPPRYDYALAGWWAEFQRKKEKNLRRDIESFDARGARLRHGETHLFDRMVEMNVSRFGSDSYFSDARFRESFRDLMALLDARGLLRVTAVHIEGVAAAVDFGSVYRGRYTLLAGGTDERFPGVAKVINHHHIEWAASERLLEVDFLCGDFKWKPLFHLEPRPLYLVSSFAPEAFEEAGAHAPAPSEASAPA